MPDEVTTTTMPPVSPRTAEIEAEAAYIAKQSADDEAVAPAKETPAPAKEVAAPEKATPEKPETPAPTAEQQTAFATSYKAEFPDATDEEIAAAFEEEGAPPAKATTDDELPELPDKPTATAEDEFTSALEKQGVKIKLDDITDPVARKFIETRLKEMTVGFTRAMQDAREYRKEEVVFRAEQRFQKDHPVDYVLGLLLDTPGLGDQVNAKITEMEQPDGSMSPTAKKAHDIVVRDAKAQARQAEETEEGQRSQWTQRGTQVEAYAIRAAEQAGVPYDLGIGEAIVALVLSRSEFDAHGTKLKQGDVTKAEVDQIIKDKAAVYSRRVRAHKRESRKAYIAQKALDAKTGGLKIKPGAGVAPGVGRKTAPKGDEDAVSYLVDALG